MKKNGSYFYITMWWFLFSAIAGGLILCFPPDEKAVSARENRELQSRPEFTASAFLSGDFSREFEAFMSDGFPFRDRIIDISTGLINRFSVNTPEDDYYLDTTEKEAAEFVMDEAIKDAAPEEADGEDSLDETPAGPEDGGDAFSDKDRAVMKLLHYDGGETLLHSYGGDKLRKAASNLEKYAELLPDDGKVYMTTVPFPAIGHMFSGNLKKYCGWETDVPEIMNRLTSDKIEFFDTLEILEPHILEGEDLFLYTDHQWTAHGAYYVFSSMIASQGLVPTPFYEYGYKTAMSAPSPEGKRDVFEFLYPLDPVKNLVVKKIDHTTEVPFMRYDTAIYLSYLSGNRLPWRTIETGFDTGRSALVIGDCFDLCFVPFLLPYYDKVHTTDIRDSYLDKGLLGTTVADMITRSGIDDIYIIFSEANDVSSETVQRYLLYNLN